MDPFTIALATFGVQKLRGKSTKRALRDAALLGGGSYALGHCRMEDQMLGRTSFISLGLGGKSAAKVLLQALLKEASSRSTFRDKAATSNLIKGAETASAEPTGI